MPGGGGSSVGFGEEGGVMPEPAHSLGFPAGQECEVQGECFMTRQIEAECPGISPGAMPALQKVKRPLPRIPDKVSHPER